VAEHQGCVHMAPGLTEDQLSFFFFVVSLNICS
jgi:hypothetical protein